MLKIKDITQLEKYKQYFTFEDSTSFFLYNSITNPTKQLHIWKQTGKIDFVNGKFKAGVKLIERLKQDNLVVEVNEMSLKIKKGININQLKQYGFQTEDDDGFIWCEPHEDIVINPNGYILVYGEDEQGNYSLDKLYDLIQAGLVEKVEG